MALDLDKIRQELDEIDRQLVALYEQRLKTCDLVADYKIEQSKPVLDAEREEQKLAAVSSLVQSPYDKRAVEELYRQIMTASRRRQYKKMAEQGAFVQELFEEVDELPGIRDKSARIVYQGVEGAYSHQAALAYFGADCGMFHVDTFEEAVRCVVLREADYAVVPIENAKSGTVTDTYDLLVGHDVYIVGEHFQAVNHALLALPEAVLSDIRSVCSHPQALMQCKEYIQEQGLREEACLNTAMSARRIQEEQDKSKAAIASEQAAALYGLQVLARNISRMENNTTRFIILSARNICRKSSGKISLMFELKHQAGALYNMLGNLIFNGVNMLHIESRPIREKSWEYRFFVDIEGKFSDAGIRNALTGIREEASCMKILGSC